MNDGTPAPDANPSPDAAPAPDTPDAAQAGARRSADVLPDADIGPQRNTFIQLVGSSIFISRWLQAPLYLGLIVAQAVYVVVFWKELVHLIKDFSHFTEADVMLLVLGLVDVVMIANLLIMVIIGGYETFVSRIRMDAHPDKPEWLSHVNPNVLKVKLAMSIIGISSIHLLKSFIDADNISPEQLKWQTIIHMAFIASAIGLAYVDWISAKSAALANGVH